MDAAYAKSKLKLLLRDLDNYNDGEFWREMSRIAYGSTTGYPNAEQLQTKLAESEARVVRLEEAANCIYHWHDSGADGMVVSSDHVRNLWQVLNETKSQSLQHIQAEAVEEFIDKQFRYRQDVDEIELWKIIRTGEHYANRLRQQVKP